MSATPTRFSSELPEITRRDRARFVKEARRRRAQELDKLFRAVGRGLARLGRAFARGGTPAHPPRHRGGLTACRGRTDAPALASGGTSCPWPIARTFPC
jgi:hypothetical protein